MVSVLLFVVVVSVGILSVRSVQPSDVMKIAVLHRHGARNSASVENMTLNYRDAGLTDVGTDMMMELGSFLRVEYGGSVIPDRYSDTLVHTVSTDYARTKQSALAVLRSLFQYPLDNPTYDYVSSSLDTMLRFAWPSVGLYDLDSVVLQRIAADALGQLGNNTVQRIGEILGAENLCAADVASCVALAQDVVRSNRSNGYPCDPFLCSDLAPALDAFQAYRFHDTLGFLTAHPTLQSEIGTFGYLWALDVLDALQTPYVMKHYSAHDSTLVGVYSALGVLTQNDTTASSFNLPSFGETVLVEFTTTGLVRARWGMPNQTYGVDHIYTFQPLAIKCMLPDGTVVQNSTCAVEDWRRYIVAVAGPAATSASSASPLCYYDTRNPYTAECFSLPIGVAPKVGSACYAFRSRCPSVACTAGSDNKDSLALDAANGYRCVYASTTKSSTSTPAATIPAPTPPSVPPLLTATPTATPSTATTTPSNSTAQQTSTATAQPSNSTAQQSVVGSSAVPVIVLSVLVVILALALVVTVLVLKLGPTRTKKGTMETEYNYEQLSVMAPIRDI